MASKTGTSQPGNSLDYLSVSLSEPLVVTVRLVISHRCAESSPLRRLVQCSGPELLAATARLAPAGHPPDADVVIGACQGDPLPVGAVDDVVAMATERLQQLPGLGIPEPSGDA